MEKAEDLTIGCNYSIYDDEGDILEATLVEVFDGLAVLEADEISYQFEVPVSELYK